MWRSDNDFESTQGLCGTLNNKCEDDFSKQDGNLILNDDCNVKVQIITESMELSTSWRYDTFTFYGDTFITPY